jgi:sugar lactone lactonase YvrE
MFSGPSRPAIVVSIVIALALSAACLIWQGRRPDEPRTLSTVTTHFSFPDREAGEPFGIAVRDGEIYFSDGAAGTIVKLGPDGKNSIFASGFNTPSGIAFLPTGDLVVADTGSHTIKKVSRAGVVSLLAGVENVAGSDDGSASAATFNGPIGVATTDNGEVYVSDTYNDRIRFIEQHGVVATVAGSSREYADGDPSDARFDTPLGIALWQDKLLVADSGNRRIRVVEPQQGVSTLAGTGEGDLRDGTLASAAFVSPTAVAVDDTGAIFIADGNSIRVVGRRAFPYVETLSGGGRGYSDGASSQARFNRPSGIAIDGSGFVLVADSDNRAIRALSGGQVGRQASADEIEERRVTADQFRDLQPPRWPYDPPGETREIAGTLGEIRGEIANARSRWFHNGLDIAGGYGEIARFIRTETVLDPHAAQNFGTARELLRLPAIGYIHLRLGRDRPTHRSQTTGSNSSGMLTDSSSMYACRAVRPFSRAISWARSTRRTMSI